MTKSSKNWSECICRECGYSWQGIEDDYNFELCNNCYSSDIGGNFWEEANNQKMKPRKLLRLLLLNLRVPIIRLIRLCRRILRKLRKRNRKKIPPKF